ASGHKNRGKYEDISHFGSGSSNHLLLSGYRRQNTATVALSKPPTNLALDAESIISDCEWRPILIIQMPQRSYQTNNGGRRDSTRSVAPNPTPEGWRQRKPKAIGSKLKELLALPS